MAKHKLNTWKWYSVKLIFENIITGDPEPETIDINYTNKYKIYEESIVLVKAQSFEHAYKIAECRAKKYEDEYTNPYSELVNVKFLEAIDCFLIFDETITSKTELYWRTLRVDKNMDNEDFLDMYYPETIKNQSNIDHDFILRNSKYNKTLNSDDQLQD